MYGSYGRSFGGFCVKQSAYRVARAKVAVAKQNRFREWLNFTAVMIGSALLAMVLYASVASARADTGAVKIELNKLEQTDKGCRFYWLVNNQSGIDLKTLDVTFYWFQSDGVIGGDLKFAFAPAGSKSLKVKKYLLANKTCSNFASLLLNEINQCSAADGPVTECAKHLEYASRTTVKFLK